MKTTGVLRGPTTVRLKHDTLLHTAVFIPISGAQHMILHEDVQDFLLGVPNIMSVVCQGLY